MCICLRYKDRPKSSIRVSLLGKIHFSFLGRHLQASNSSFTIFRFVFFQVSLLTFSLHSLNQSAKLLTSLYLGLDSCSQIQQRRLRRAQPRWLWRSTQSTFRVSVSSSVLSPTPARSLLPTLSPSPHNAESARGLVTLLRCARKRHKPAQSALSSTTVPPTDAPTKAVRK